MRRGDLSRFFYVMKPIVDNHFETLDRTQVSAPDYELALCHAPRIRFDEHEPFLPSVVGYTIFREDAESPSFARHVMLPEGATCAIEYAVWWDWDIQHLYELEHIWVYLDVDEQVVAADASWHGGFHAMVDASGDVPLEEGRVTLYSEPGKHAFAPVLAWLTERAPHTRAGCGVHAGKGGVLVTSLFQGKINDRTPLNNQLAWSYLERHTFEPAYVFNNYFDLSDAVHVPWATLFEWIPERVKWWTVKLQAAIPAHERRVIRIAHRGASAHAQENSLAAIHKAVELGADMVEVDVRLTADGVPVVSHDENLKRVFGVEGVISDFSWDELQAIITEAKGPIVSLEQLAEVCRSLSIGLYLDIKQINFEAVQPMFDILERHHLFGATIFGSFRPDWLAEIKAQEPRARTSILFSSVHVDPVAQARAIQCDFVHPCWERFDEPHMLLTQKSLERIREAGLGVVCWHEERLSEIRALQALGVYAICSDSPELLLPETG